MRQTCALPVLTTFRAQVAQNERAFEEQLNRIAEHTAHTERLIGDIVDVGLRGGWLSRVLDSDDFRRDRDALQNTPPLLAIDAGRQDVADSVQ